MTKTKLKIELIVRLLYIRKQFFRYMWRVTGRMNRWAGRQIVNAHREYEDNDEFHTSDFDFYGR